MAEYPYSTHADSTGTNQGLKARAYWESREDERSDDWEERVEDEEE